MAALHGERQPTRRLDFLTSTERICSRTALCLLGFGESQLPPSSELAITDNRAMVDNTSMLTKMAMLIDQLTCQLLYR